MPQTFGCPYCRGAVAVPDELMGGPITCPFCRNVFTAVFSPPPPAPPQPPAPAQTKAADPLSFSSKKKKRRDEDEDEDEQDDEGEYRSSYQRSNQKPQMTLASGVVMAIGIAVILGLAFSLTTLPRVPAGELDVPRAVVKGLIGATLAVTVGVGRMMMSTGGRRGPYRGGRR